MRVYPSVSVEVIGYLKNVFPVIQNSSKGLIAFAWLLGQFGSDIKEAVYILEDILDSINNIEESTELLYTVVNSAVKLFFIYPRKTKPVLSKVFTFISKNCEDVDLRDRVSYLINLFRDDVEAVRSVVCSNNVVAHLAEEKKEEFILDTYHNFNTLAIIYEKSEDKFVKRTFENEEEEAENEEEQSEQEEQPKVDLQPISLVEGECDYDTWISLKNEQSDVVSNVLKTQAEEIEIEGFVDYLGENKVYLIKQTDKGAQGFSLLLVAFNVVD